MKNENPKTERLWKPMREDNFRLWELPFVDFVIVRMWFAAAHHLKTSCNRRCMCVLDALATRIFW
jgi:hypothetical protein